MKRWIAALVLWALCLSSATAETTDGALSLTIALDSNATTGYAWTGFVLGGDSVTLESADGVYVSDPNPDALCGIGGTTYFTLNAVEPGTSIVQFEYRRAGEHAPAARQLLLVLVDDALNICTQDVTEDSVIEGSVASVDVDEHSATLVTDDLGELIARFRSGDALPTQGETIRIYTNGAMTMSLPAIVNALAWERIPPEAARDDAPSSAAEMDATLPAFREATGLDAFLAGVSAENPLSSVTFTEGGELPDESFETDDPTALTAFVDALAQIEITSVSDMSVTDWSPRFCLIRADGDTWRISFEGHWLRLNGQNYNLTGDDAFWAQIAQLKAQAAP